MPTGAELLVHGLRRAGVEIVFGLPGVHNLPAWRALASSGIRLVTVRHEQTAVYAADGYARATGRPGVAITTTGPGAANTLGALGEAWASRSPVVVIATDVATTLSEPGRWRGVLHEMTDQSRLFEPLVKERLRCSTAEGIDVILQYALSQALMPPSRPVYVEIPSDRLTSDGGEPGAGGGGMFKLAPPEASLAEAAKRLAAAERPLIWAGGGAVAAGAARALGRLAERLGAPVLTTYSARGLLGADHPCAVGLPPHVPEAGALWDEADVVLVVGSDLDGMMTQNWQMPAPPTLIAVNVDGEDASKSYKPDILLTGDAASVCGTLAERVGEANRTPPELASLREIAYARLEREHPAELAFVRACEQVLPDDAVVVCDMCIPGYWLGGFLPLPGPRRLQYPVGWGTLGYAFPAAIGAALAGAGTVVSFSGDGGFLYACGELATVAQEKVPLTAVIVDDGGYGMLRFDSPGETLQGIDLDSPDFAAMARAFGVRAEEVEGLGDAFATKLIRHVADPAPSVLVAKAALEPPPTTSPRWYRR